MSVGVPSYIKRKLEDKKTGDEKVQSFLAEVARGLSDLTDEGRAEAERLISMPFGADQFALGRFISAHRQAMAA